MESWLLITAYSLVMLSVVSATWEAEKVGVKYRGPLGTSFNSAVKASTAYGVLAGLGTLGVLSGTALIMQN